MYQIKRSSDLFIVDNQDIKRINSNVNEDNEMQISGYAAVYNQASKLITERVYLENGASEVRSFYEYVDSKAFDEVLSSIDRTDVVFNTNHDLLLTLARTTSRTLVISSDAIGLKYDVLLPATERGREVYEGVKRGDYYESSFQATVSKDKWERIDNKTWKHTILNISRLLDVCVATYRGCYDNTDVAIAGRINDQNIFELETVANIENNDYLIEYEYDNDLLKLKK
jgi:hypothetical protein